MAAHMASPHPRPARGLQSQAARAAPGSPACSRPASWHWPTTAFRCQAWPFFSSSASIDVPRPLPHHARPTAVHIHLHCGEQVSAAPSACSSATCRRRLRQRHHLLLRLLLAPTRPSPAPPVVDRAAHKAPPHSSTSGRGTTTAVSMSSCSSSLPASRFPTAAPLSSTCPVLRGHNRATSPIWRWASFFPPACSWPRAPGVGYVPAPARPRGCTHPHAANTHTHACTIIGANALHARPPAPAPVPMFLLFFFLFPQRALQPPWPQIHIRVLRFHQRTAVAGPHPTHTLVRWVGHTYVVLGAVWGGRRWLGLLVTCPGEDQRRHGHCLQRERLAATPS